MDSMMNHSNKNLLCRRPARALRLAFLAAFLNAAQCHTGAQPILGPPILGPAPGAAQISLTNCTDTNFQYVVQLSTNLLNWASVTTNPATSPSNPVTVPATNPFAFYRVKVVPNLPTALFRWAIVVRSNINMNGSYNLVDSFDSGNPLYSTVGQYDPAKRKANGDIATDSPEIGAVSIGNGVIYGHVMTGPGSLQTYVQVGPNGAVGDSTWNASNIGIEPGHWSGNFYLNFPDVSPPPTGPLTNLPAPDASGYVNLSGNYTVSPTDPDIGAPLKITGPASLWVQGFYSPSGITVATTNNASLALYVGKVGGSGDSLSLEGNGAINSPGYAANLQFYGLPSLTSISLSGNASIVGTIYAPEAAFTGNGGGGNPPATSGAMIVKSVTLNSAWKIHYDESLQVDGPTF
jgi:hypothetical protein